MEVAPQFAHSSKDVQISSHDIDTITLEAVARRIQQPQAAHTRITDDPNPTDSSLPTTSQLQESPSLKAQVRDGAADLKDNANHADPRPLNKPSWRQLFASDHSCLVKLIGVDEPCEDKSARITTSFVLVVALTYFVQGVLDLGTIAMQIFLINDLAVTPSTISKLFGIMTIAWIPKFVYAFMSDSWPICGFRRRPYLFMSALLTCMAYVSMAWVDSSHVLTFVGFLAFLGTAISDVVADAMVVERTQGKSTKVASRLQSLSWGSRSIGAVISSFAGGLVLETLGPKEVFWCISIFPAFLCICIWFVQERAVTSAGCSGAKQKLVQLWRTLTKAQIFFPVCFTMLLGATPSAGQAYTTFLMKRLEFSASFMAFKQGVVAIGFLLSIIIFNKFCASTPLRKLLAMSTIVSCLLGSLSLEYIVHPSSQFIFISLGFTSLLLVMGINQKLGIPDKVFAVGDDMILTVTVVFQLLATLILSARICPPGIEGTLFACIMGLVNLSSSCSSLLGGILTDMFGVVCEKTGMENSSCNFDNLAALLVVCNFSTLLPLLVIKWVPDERQLAARHE